MTDARTRAERIGRRWNLSRMQEDLIEGELEAFAQEQMMNSSLLLRYQEESAEWQRRAERAEALVARLDPEKRSMDGSTFVVERRR